MRPFHLTTALAAVVAAAVLGTGCDSGGRYPDQSEQTRREADAIRTQARASKAEIDREHDERATAIAFRERQIKDKARQERESIALERDQPKPALQRKADELRSKADSERAEIERTTAERLRAPGDRDEAQIRAEATAKRAETDRALATGLAEVNAELAKLDAKAKERLAEVDKREADQLAKTSQEAAEAKNQARERKLAVDRDSSQRLDKLGASAQKRGADDDRRDQEISEQIRADLARDRALAGKAGDVVVSTDDGVVTLSGSVPSESERRAVVARAQGAAGVRRVDDRLAVR